MFVHLMINVDSIALRIKELVIDTKKNNNFVGSMYAISTGSSKLTNTCRSQINYYLLQMLFTFPYQCNVARYAAVPVSEYITTLS